MYREEKKISRNYYETGMFHLADRYQNYFLNGQKNKNNKDLRYNVTS